MHRRREDEEVVDVVDVGEEREKGSGVGGTAVELPRATPVAGDGAAVGLDGGADQPLELVVAHVASLRRVAHELLELVVLLHEVRLCPLRHWRWSCVALDATEDPRVQRVGVEDQDALDDGAAIHELPPPVLPARIRRARPCVFVAHELVVLASSQLLLSCPSVAPRQAGPFPCGTARLVGLSLHSSECD